MRLRLTVLLVIVAAVAVPATASASEIIDRNANDVSLKVAHNGQALVSYRGSQVVGSATISETVS